MGSRRALVALLLALAACGDNFHAGGGDLVVSPQTALRTDESGGEATFMLSLTVPPVDNVVVRVESNNSHEGKVSSERVTFTPDDFSDPHIVTIIGVDDHIADGDRAYSVRAGVGRDDSVDLEAINGDDDMPGVSVSPITGLMTSESGTLASFTVALTSEPIASVFIPLLSSDDSEGTPSTTMLELTPANWDKPQTVTVTPVQDALTDGPVTYVIQLAPIGSADLGYRMLDPDDVQITNADDDSVLGTPGYVVVPTSGLVTSESGATAMFTVRR